MHDRENEVILLLQVMLRLENLVVRDKPLFKICRGLTNNSALTKQYNILLISLVSCIKKVTERLCGWLETILWGFNSLLSRLVICLYLNKSRFLKCVVWWGTSV